MLDVDRKAAGPEKIYDAKYYEQLRAGAGAIAERRLNDSVDAVVSVITAAWREAGSPALP